LKPGLPPGTFPDIAPDAAIGTARAQQYLAQFYSTLNACQTAARPQTLPPPAVIWQEGTTRVLDYGPFCPDAAAARLVLVIPSLVNRAHILDLSAERSFLRHLCQAGFRPLLVDWDVPGPVERMFGLGGYISRLLRSVAALAGADGPTAGPIPVIGYCMGGLLATALAVMQPEAVRGLVLLATPWDFHAATSAGQRVHLDRLWPHLDSLLHQQGEMPVAVLQALLATLDPFAMVNRYVQFAARTDTLPESERQHFFALEDWLADGVPLSVPVARETLLGWYRDNQPVRGEWRITLPEIHTATAHQDTVIDPARLACPLMIVTPQRDRIVPPLSALALGAGVASVSLLQPRTGHIGMVAGRKAESEMWQGVARWLTGIAEGQLQK
jgi:polyhydroxyalkanoate synthase